jgi:glutathione peroxidase
MAAIHDFTVKTITGQDLPLSTYEGQVMLVVNTASKCGFTPQYRGLEALHKDLAPRGLVVMGFPCNQFGAQEPGDEAEIATFCSLTYDVDFPMFAKVDVNGDSAAPLFKHLRKEAPGLMGSTAIKWNFTKFLVDRAGKVVGRFAPQVTPEQMRKEIEALL